MAFIPKSVLPVQRKINDYDQEPLLAIVPGIALQELWSLMGGALFYLITIIAQPFMIQYFGLYISISMPSISDFLILLMILFAGFFMGLIPGYQAYRRSLADGLTLRI